MSNLNAVKLLLHLKFALKPHSSWQVLRPLDRMSTVVEDAVVH